MPSFFRGASLFWVFPSGRPFAQSHPDEPCKQPVSTHLALLCRRPDPPSSHVGPTLIVHTSCMCWKLETISPSALAPATHNAVLPPTNPKICLAHPKNLKTSMTDQDRKCSGLVVRTDRRLLYQLWKTDEISCVGGGQTSCTICLNSECSWYLLLP